MEVLRWIAAAPANRAFHAHSLTKTLCGNE
jgi:hypothetical protein